MLSGLRSLHYPTFFTTFSIFHWSNHTLKAKAVKHSDVVTVCVWSLSMFLPSFWHTNTRQNLFTATLKIFLSDFHESMQQKQWKKIEYFCCFSFNLTFFRALLSMRFSLFKCHLLFAVAIAVSLCFFGFGWHVKVEQINCKKGKRKNVLLPKKEEI